MRTPITPKMRANLRSLPVDVVHAHSPPPLASYYAGAVAGERGTPYIVTYHCDVELPSALGTLAESIYRRSLGESTLRNAAQVIVTTRTYGATSRAVWRYNPVVVPNAVDHRRFRPDVDGSAIRERLNVALEAMATAKPVIVADIPGVREVIQDGREGLHADPMNARDLAEKIRRLLGDPEARRVMGERGREKVLASFGIERVTDQIESVYRTVLGRRTGPTSRP